MENSGRDHVVDEHVVVGESGEDVAEKRQDSQQPIAVEDGHGSITPRSAPPASAQTGHVTPDQKRGPDAAEVEAAGEAQE